MAESTQRVTLSRSLYVESAVRSAAAAFAQVATVTLDVQDDAIELGLDGVADGLDPQHVLDELCNHALFHTIVAARRSDAGALA